MKKIVALSLILASSAAQADIIKCVFTEPLVGSTYSMSRSTLTYVDFEQKKQEIKNVSFQIKSAGVFELVSKEGKVLQTLTLNNKGSNGMSDTIYPFDVKDSGSEMMPQGNYGGCTSNYLKATEPK